MSSKTDEEEAIAGALILPICLLAAFFAVFLTPICIMALIFGPMPIWRGVTITPTEARDFLIRGIVGAILVPMFVVLCLVLFQTRIIPEAWPYFILAGYTLGSIIVGVWIEKDREKSVVAAPPPAPVQQILPPPPPYRFAEWDDRDAR